jgi:hypothetical protein
MFNLIMKCAQTYNQILDELHLLGCDAMLIAKLLVIFLKDPAASTFRIQAVDSTWHHIPEDLNIQ